MTADSVAEERLNGKKSLRLAIGFVAVLLVVSFLGEIATMLLLPGLLPADTSESTRMPSISSHIWWLK